MPAIASTVIGATISVTTTPTSPNPLARTNLKNVTLLSLVAFIVAAFTTYAVIKAVKLYREHLETEELARKVWDAEVG